MYVHTKLANKCVVTEIAEIAAGKQHMIETPTGYIIRVVHNQMLNDIRITAVLCGPDYFNTVNTVCIPARSYRALRAALKAFIALAPIHAVDRATVY